MKLGNINEYQRLFRHKGFRFLVNEIWVKAYQGYGALAMVLNDEYISYMPHAMVQKTLKEGLELFLSKESFTKYFNNVKRFQRKFISFCEELLKADDFSKAAAEEFFEGCIENLILYKRTEFIFTDKAYAETQRTTSPALTENIRKFKKIKFQCRDFLNSIFMGRESYVYRILEKA